MLQISVSPSPLGPSGSGSAPPVPPVAKEEEKKKSDILEAKTHELMLEKSNILMLGPTGSGRKQQKSKNFFGKMKLQQKCTKTISTKLFINSIKDFN